MTTEPKTALVVGSTGLTGLNLAAHLVARGRQVYGLARKPKEMRSRKSSEYPSGLFRLRDQGKCP